MAAPVTDRFRQLLNDGYQVVARLEVLNPAGTVILDSAAAGQPLNVVGGTITVDGSASLRRSIGDLVLVDPTGALIPMTSGAVFAATSSNELRLSLGMMVDSEPEYVEQGVFDLEGVKVDDTESALTITLSAFDRARKYSRSKRLTPKNFLASGDPAHPAGWLIRDAIVELLQDAYPGTMVVSDSPTYLLPSQLVAQGADPWEAARGFAASMGYDLYHDRIGDLQLARVKDPNDPSLFPSWTYAEGSSGLLTVRRTQSNQDVFNGVVVTGENPSNAAPVSSDPIWDDNPNSPTWYLGPYGQVPTFIQSDKVRTVGQANAMATAELNKVKGATEVVEFTIVPNPAIEPGDAVRIVRARSGFPASGTGSEPLVVESYSMGLFAGDGEMTVRCRQRRLA